MAEPPLPQPDAPSFRRLHPATVITEVIRKIGSMIYLIVGALAAQYLGGRGSESDWAEYFIAIVVGLSGGLSLLRYISVRYGFDGDRFVIRSGIIQRQIRTIPINKIQNINLKRNVIHRALGVVALKIETAVAGQAEAELSVLSVSAAEELRAELLRRKQGTPLDEPIEPEPDALWSASLKDLLIVGATENRAGVIMAGIGGAYYTFQDIAERFWGPVEQQVERLLGTSASSAILLAVLGLCALVLAGWIFSIVLTVVTYYGFTLRRSEDRLRRRYGLFTQVETVVLPRRIQVLRLQSPILRRIWGFFTVYAETAGSAKDEKSGGSSPLCPLVRQRDVDPFCRVAFPDLEFGRVEWNPVSRVTIRRGFIRAMLALLLFLGIGILADLIVVSNDAGPRFGWRLLWGLPVAIALASGWAWARYRALGYAEIDSFVLARAGVWTRKIWIIPQDKIQSVQLTQSPLQRRLALANLSIDTAGTDFLGGAEVVDLPAEVATTLQDKLSQSANAMGMWLPDGV